MNKEELEKGCLDAFNEFMKEEYAIEVLRNLDKKMIELIFTSGFIEGGKNVANLVKQNLNASN